METINILKQQRKLTQARAKKLSKNLAKAYKSLVSLGDEYDTLSEKEKALIFYYKNKLIDNHLFDRL